MAVIDGNIRCSECKTFKPVSEYQPSVIKVGCGLCRSCKYIKKEAHRKANRDQSNASKRRARNANLEKYQETARKWQRDNPEKLREYSYKKNYGIGVQEYEALLTSQDGKCACCGREANTCGRKLFVDHCHDTGRVRGIICNRCNYGIGALGDNIDGVQRAIEYLKRGTSWQANNDAAGSFF